MYFPSHKCINLAIPITIMQQFYPVVKIPCFCFYEVYVKLLCFHYDSREGDCIKVFVRVRPPMPNATDMDRSCLDVHADKSSIVIQCKPEPRVFTFDKVAGMDTTQVGVVETVWPAVTVLHMY